MIPRYLADEKSTQTGDHPVRRGEIRRTLAATVQDQKLTPDQDGFGGHAAKSAVGGHEGTATGTFTGHSGSISFLESNCEELGCAARR
jgi:hypothetical protein